MLNLHGETELSMFLSLHFKIASVLHSVIVHPVHKKNNKIQRECCVMFGDSLIMMVKWLSIATSEMPPFVITFFIIVVMLQQSVSLEMHLFYHKTAKSTELNQTNHCKVVLYVTIQMISCLQKR